MSNSKDAPLSDTQAWESLGPISRGGTVFGLAVSPVPDVSRYWAATGCGIYYSDDGGETWAQTLSGLTTPLLSSLAVASNGALLAGSLVGDLFVSFDYGKTWRPGLVPQESRATITSVLPTPLFRKNGSAFAATDGGGLLVTRNSGKSWEDSSFGLGDSIVLAVATAPDWSKRETMFAATSEGVFTSINGGRAWRETELMLDDDVVDALAVSPAFESDRTVFAGTENGAVYRSSNAGRTWDLLEEKLGDGPVNALWVAPDFEETGVVLVGVGSELYLSQDTGDSWESVAALPNAILAIAGDIDVILVGLHDQGVFKSTDRGKTWQPSSEGFSARGFARLVASDKKLFAMGPQEGLWVSSDQGHTWENAPGLDEHMPLTAFHLTPEGEAFLVSQNSGILRATGELAQWEVVDSTIGVQALYMAGRDGWAGTMDGKLLKTLDGGTTWSEAESPCDDCEILSIVASPNYVQDRTVLLGAAVEATASQQARVGLWRSTNSGGTWRAVTTQVTTARWLDIAIPDNSDSDPADRAVLATGPFCLRPLQRAKEVWISTRVDPSGANTLSLLVLGDLDSNSLLYAATGNGIYHSVDDGRTWQPSSGETATQSFVSLASQRLDDEHAVYALSLGGVLFRKALS